MFRYWPMYQNLGYKYHRQRSKEYQAYHQTPLQPSAVTENMFNKGALAGLSFACKSNQFKLFFCPFCEVLARIQTLWQ
jgi:hypothetical protein